MALAILRNSIQIDDNSTVYVNLVKIFILCPVQIFKTFYIIAVNVAIQDTPGNIFAKISWNYHEISKENTF